MIELTWQELFGIVMWSFIAGMFTMWMMYARLDKPHGGKGDDDD